MNTEAKRIGEEIASMKIRGAGRIAVAASKAIRAAAVASKAADPVAFSTEIKEVARYLVSTRPTAVSLPNAVRYVLRNGMNGDSVDELKDAVVSAASEFEYNAENALVAIGDYGAKRILSGDKILTVCNSNAAIEIMKRAHSQGKDIEVFAMETRPRFQGRLTAQALASEGIDVSLIVDSAARYYMKDIDHVITGADAIAANGAVINKIGTAAAALAAHESRARVMVAAESYKFHPDTIVGKLVTIEERDGNEIIAQQDREALGAVGVHNPVFDITPPEYIDLIVTDRGVLPPQASFYLITTLYGWNFTDKEPWD